MDKIGKSPVTRSRKILYALLIGGPLIGLIMLVAGISIYFYSCSPSPRPPAFIEKAKPQVEAKKEKISDKLSLSKDSDKSNTYDLDETVRALFSIELALDKAKNFEDLTQFIVQDDPELASPEVLALKYRFFKVYGELLDSRDSVKEMNSLYNITSGALLDLVSTVNYSGLSASIDHEQAKKIWEKRVADSDLNAKTKARLTQCQDHMIDFYFDYMNTASKYLNEWNRLCSFRDRAYLAVHEGNWEEAIRNAASAVQMAPHEKEAHILLAMAMLERGQETDSPTVKVILDSFQKNQEGQNAPAWLLSGVINLKNKKYESALLDFEQAAAYYPKQQNESLERLNLYKRRGFLNKSKEGRVIINSIAA